MSQKRSCIKPFMSDLEQTNLYRHHTAQPWLVMHIYMHIKWTVGRMMANLNDLYSVDELVDVCSR